MGRYTPAWALGFAVGASTLILGFALSHDVVLLAGAVLTLGSLAGQSFLPGPPTAEEQERDREARDDPHDDAHDRAPTPVAEDSSGAGEESFEVVEAPQEEDPEEVPEPQEEDRPGEGGTEATAGPGARPTEYGSRGSGTGVTRGRCGNCGTRLKLSDRRPVKAICPQCGRSRVLES